MFCLTSSCYPMKNFLFTACFCVILTSCEKKTGEAADKLNFTFTVTDTLMVDSGEEVLFLQYNLNSSYVDPNGKYLYNYNSLDNSIELIDLDSLKLSSKIHFDHQGPDGTGGYAAQMQYLSDDQILMTEYHQINIFNAEGVKTSHLKIKDQVFNGDTLSDQELVSPFGLLDNSGTYFFTTYEKAPGEVLGLAKIHIKEKTLHKIPIPQLRELEKFKFTLFSEGRRVSTIQERLFLDVVGGNVLISSTAINEIYVYDVQNDTLMHRSFESNLTANRKKEYEKNRVESTKEMQSLMKKQRDVSFLNYVYDPINQRYYRFSQKFEKEGPEGNINRPVLTVFDRNFDPIFETDQLPLEKITYKYFAKDGKLYLYENVLDEMGFIVMEIKEI